MTSGLDMTQADGGQLDRHKLTLKGADAVAARRNILMLRPAKSGLSGS